MSLAFSLVADSLTTRKINDFQRCAKPCIPKLEPFWKKEPYIIDLCTVKGVPRHHERTFVQYLEPKLNRIDASTLEARAEHHSALVHNAKFRSLGMALKFSLESEVILLQMEQTVRRAVSQLNREYKLTAQVLGRPRRRVSILQGRGAITAELDSIVKSKFQNVDMTFKTRQFHRVVVRAVRPRLCEEQGILLDYSIL
jgi:hypothetical protein